MKSLLKILIIGFLTNSFIKADWPVRYSQEENYWNNSLAIVSDNSSNSYITGSRQFASPYCCNYSSLTTICYNTAGVQQWVSIHPCNNIFLGYDQGRAITIDPTGYYIYVTGRLKVENNGYDYITIKYSVSNGNTIWERTYNGSGNGDDIAHHVECDADGNVYVTGQSRNLYYYYDYVTIKYNSSGRQLWAVTYNGYGYDNFAYSLKVDNNGSVFVTGQSSNGSNSDFATVCYNSSGNQKWVQRYDNNGDDYGTDLAVISDYAVYVVGTNQNNNGQLMFTTLKYDLTTPTQNWINSDHTGIAYSIQIYQNPDCTLPCVDIYVTGYGGLYNGGDCSGTYYGQTIKYNDNGVQQWRSTYNYNNYSSLFHNLKIDYSQNVYVCGYTVTYCDIYQNRLHGFLTVKYDNNGNKLWDDILEYNNESDAYGLAFDNNNNVFVTGIDEVDFYTRDCLTMKYNSSNKGLINKFVYNKQNLNQNFAQQFSLKQKYSDNKNALYYTYKYEDSTTFRINKIVNKKNSNEFQLYQNSPNPFNPDTKIVYNIPKEGIVKLKIYDIAGKEIYAITEFKLPGTYEITFDGSNFVSGVYFYRIEAGTIVVSKKMILLK